MSVHVCEWEANTMKSRLRTSTLVINVRSLKNCRQMCYYCSLWWSVSTNAGRLLSQQHPRIDGNSTREHCRVVVALLNALCRHFIDGTLDFSLSALRRHFSATIHNCHVISPCFYRYYRSPQPNGLRHPHHCVLHSIFNWPFLMNSLAKNNAICTCVMAHFKS